MQIEKFQANLISKIRHMKIWKSVSRNQMTQAIYRAFLLEYSHFCKICKIKIYDVGYFIILVLVILLGKGFVEKASGI